MTEEKTLKLDEVTIDNSLNPREGALDQDVVMEYAMHYQDLPPMHVFAVAGAGYLLVAGFHRIAAHRLAGAAEGRFVVHQGSRLDAAEFADLDNLKHGLRLSRAEKRQVIERQLKRHPDWSDVRIAATCNTTDKTVRSVREELEARSEIPKLDVLVGTDGISRPRTVSRQPVGEAVFSLQDGKLKMELGPLGDQPAQRYSVDLGRKEARPEPETDDDLAGPDPDAELEIQAEAEQELQDEAEQPEPEAEAQIDDLYRRAAERQEMLAQMKAHQSPPPAAPKAAPAPAPSPQPPAPPQKLEMVKAAPQALEMKKAEPDTVITITIKPTRVCLISVQAEGQPPRLLSSHRESLLEKLQELLAPEQEAGGQAEEWLEAG